MEERWIDDGANVMSFNSSSGTLNDYEEMLFGICIGFFLGLLSLWIVWEGSLGGWNITKRAQWTIIAGVSVHHFNTVSRQCELCLSQVDTVKRDTFWIASKASLTSLSSSLRDADLHQCARVQWKEIPWRPRTWIMLAMAISGGRNIKATSGDFMASPIIARTDIAKAVFSDLTLVLCLYSLSKMRPRYIWAKLNGRLTLQSYPSTRRRISSHVTTCIRM